MRPGMGAALMCCAWGTCLVSMCTEVGVAGGRAAGSMLCLHKVTQQNISALQAAQEVNASVCFGYTMGMGP